MQPQGFGEKVRAGGNDQVAAGDGIADVHGFLRGNVHGVEGDASIFGLLHGKMSGRQQSGECFLNAIGVVYFQYGFPGGLGGVDVVQLESDLAGELAEKILFEFKIQGFFAHGNRRECAGVRGSGDQLRVVENPREIGEI